MQLTLIVGIFLSAIFLLLYTLAADLIQIREEKTKSDLLRLRQHNLMLSARLARSLDTVEILLDSTVLHIANTGDWRQWDETDGLLALRRPLSRNFPQLRQLVIYDAGGIVRHRSGGQPSANADMPTDTSMSVPRDIHDSALFAQVKSGTRRSSYHFFLLEPDLPTFAVAQRLETESGDFSGLLVAFMEPSFFKHFCISLLPDDTIEAVIVDAQDRTLPVCISSSKNISSLVRHDGERWRLFALTAKVKRPQGELDYFVKNVVVSSGAPEYPELHIVSGAPRRYFAGHWGESSERAVLLTGSALVMLIAAVLLIRRQFRQLRLLAQKLREHRNSLKKRIAKATRELEIRRRRAESDTRAKSQFLAAVTHDLRQPLHALQLFADNLAQITTTPEENFLVHRIREAATAIGEHLERLLLLSRLSLSEMPQKKDLVQVYQILQRLRTIYLPLAAQKNIRLLIVDSRAYLFTDVALLERLIGNLIDNALKFSPPGSTVFVCARRAHRGREPSRPALRLEVRDNGPGIAKEHQHVIYNEFVQLGNPERAAGAGLGLGLSIVHRIAEVLGAKLSLRSSPGRGSVFAFTLPLARPPTEEETKIGEVPPLLILIGMSDDFADSATRWGYPIRRAPDIASAWCLFEEVHAIPIIAHDCRGPLPYEIEALLRQHPGIVVTPARERIEPLGPYHLREPIKPATLRALLRSLHPAADDGD